MSNETILIYLKVSVPEGNTSEFEQLMNELVSNTEKEAGTLVYEWYSSEDRQSWHIVEKYANGEEGDKHVKGFAEGFANRFFELADGCEALVSDNATPYIRGVLESLSPLYVGRRGGFNR